MIAATIFSGEIELCRWCRVSRDLLEADGWDADNGTCFDCSSTRCRCCGSTDAQDVDADRVRHLASKAEIESNCGVLLCPKHMHTEVDRDE